MREIHVYSYVTLDGVMQAPGGPEEDPTGGFTHGGWSFGYWDDSMNQGMGASMSRPFDLLLGRRTYEIFAAYWPYQEGPISDALNRAGKYVASTTLDSVDWQNSQLLEGDVVAAIRRLKEEDGPELRVIGSGDLIQTLLAHELVDELHVWTFPLLLGTGRRLFDGGAVPAGLELTESHISSTGVVLATYRTGTEIKSGSFVADEPSAAELARREKLKREG